MRFKAVHKFYGAVMLNLKAFSKQAHGGAGGSGQPFNGQQRLILLRFYAGSAGCLLAQILEAPHLVSKFREGAIIYVFDWDGFQGPANIS